MGQWINVDSLIILPTPLHLHIPTNPTVSIGRSLFPCPHQANLCDYRDREDLWYLLPQKVFSPQGESQTSHQMILFFVLVIVYRSDIMYIIHKIKNPLVMVLVRYGLLGYTVYIIHGYCMGKIAVINDDPILQDSSQEPSTSSKSPNYPFSVKSCLILIKLSGYLSCHLTTWSIMLKMIPSSKSPVRNHQHPPSPKLTLSQPNHIRSWSNFYSSLINQHNFKAILQLSWACSQNFLESFQTKVAWQWCCNLVSKHKNVDEV